MQIDHIIIGSGIAGLTNACLWANEGKKVLVLEKNWLAGGCSSSYPRKNYIFESGATTLVGLDENMPLKYLLEKIGVEIPVVALPIPMKIHLKNGETITRYATINQWITEAERVFGAKNQRAFWEYCFKISQNVWQTSLQQTSFPPSSISDLFQMAKSFRPAQMRYISAVFSSVEDLLHKFDLHDNQLFTDFVDEQLLITAQNYRKEVNVLFGATALCYTLFGNYYVKGGLMNLVKPLVNFIEQKGGELLLRKEVYSIKPYEEGYEVSVKDMSTKQVTVYKCKQVTAAIPINNVVEIFENEKIKAKYSPKLFTSKQLHSAFTMGIVFRKTVNFDCLHHQLHLENPLPIIGSKSIFISTSHPEDKLRCTDNEVVINVSTHIPDPENTWIEDKTPIENAIFEALEKANLFDRKDLLFYHSSAAKSWQKWTSRKYGFVGGYPQYIKIKPWQMLDARLDGKNAYLCGDSAYPGQGIPGACLSGIIAFEKGKR